MKKILLFSTIVLIFILFIFKEKTFFQKQRQNIIDTIDLAPTVIQKNGLPNKHLIKTTFVPQAPEKIWDQPWQDSCEEAALLTVNYFYQNKNPDTNTVVSDLKKIFDYENKEAWSHDVNISQMATISEKLWGYQSTVIDNPSIDDLKKYLSLDIPIIVPANGKTLFKENSHFKSGGPWYHNLVILGYDDTKSQFIVHDVGTQFGAYFHYSYSLLIDSIHDFPTSLKKEEINTGTPRVLVLLK